jgi:hypothetical protein
VQYGWVEMKRDGWERLSIRANTRPDRLPARTTPDDLLLPSGPGSVRMFVSCAAAAFGIAVFFVLAPLALFVAFTPIESLGRWPWIAAGTAFAAAWCWLYGAARRERTEVRRWAED